MESWLPIFYLMVILKIPVGFLLYVVWWAFKQETPAEEAPESGGEHKPHRFRREPKRPNGPRRGPHSPDAVPAPAGAHEGRTRTHAPRGSRRVSA